MHSQAANQLLCSNHSLNHLMPEDDLLPPVVMYVPCVQNGAVPTCSVLYRKSKSGSFLIGVWYVPWQLVLICFSADGG